MAPLPAGEDWFLRLTALMLFVLSRVEQGPLTLYRRLLPKVGRVNGWPLHVRPLTHTTGLQSNPIAVLHAVLALLISSHSLTLRALPLPPPRPPA